MKKTIFLTVLVMLIGTLAAYNSFKKLDADKLEKSTYDTSQQNTDITVAINEEVITLEPESLTLIYTNAFDKEYIYGKEPHPEMEIHGTWYVIPSLEDIA
ncbi:MAG: hypothetical protein GX962_04500 [Epulopiscium sp.]|nr:hypothetical protein [Candidatus Epulonipiscium sp.]